MTVTNITEAKAQLSKIVEMVVTKGQEVIIGRSGKPEVKIIPYQPKKKHQRIGCFEGKIKMSPDFNEWPDDLKTSFGMIDNENTRR